MKIKFLLVAGVMLGASVAHASGTASSSSGSYCSATCIAIDRRMEVVSAQGFEAVGKNEIDAFNKVAAQCRLYNVGISSVQQKLLVIEYVMGPKRVGNVVIPGMYLTGQTEANPQNCKYDLNEVERSRNLRRGDLLAEESL